VDDPQTAASNKNQIKTLLKWSFSGFRFCDLDPVIWQWYLIVLRNLASFVFADNAVVASKLLGNTDMQIRKNSSDQRTDILVHENSRTRTDANPASKMHNFWQVVCEASLSHCTISR